jgi:hypothetical protein
MASASPNPSIGSGQQRSDCVSASGVGILPAAQRPCAASGEAEDGRRRLCVNRSAARAGLQQTSEAGSKEAPSVRRVFPLAQGLHPNTVIGVALAEIAEIPPGAHPLGETAKLRTEGSVSSCKWISARDSPAFCCLFSGCISLADWHNACGNCGNSPWTAPMGETAALPTG